MHAAQIVCLYLASVKPWSSNDSRQWMIDNVCYNIIQSGWICMFVLMPQEFWKTITCWLTVWTIFIILSRQYLCCSSWLPGELWFWSYLFYNNYECIYNSIVSNVCKSIDSQFIVIHLNAYETQYRDCCSDPITVFGRPIFVKLIKIVNVWVI